MVDNSGAGAPDVTHPDEEHIDGCLCGSGLGAADATPDDQLPAASGGVALPPPPPDSDNDHDHADGCDAVAGATDFTTDEALPPAAGGVF